MKLKANTTIFLGVATILTFIAGGAYGVLFISMKNKTAATAGLLAEIAELSSKESNLVSSISVLNNESSNIEKLSSYFFDENGIIAFAKQVEDLGPQSGTAITIESLEPGISEKSTPFISLRIKATGTFTDVERLLVLLENFPGKLDWKTIRLVREAVSVGSAPMWTAEVFLSALNYVK